MHVMFIPSWYHNKRNLVHGSFFKEQAMALKDAGVKVTVAYNEIWPLTLMFKVKEKRGLSFNIEDGLRTYRYKDFNYKPKNPKMFDSFNKRLEKLYLEIVKKEGKVDIIHCHSSFWAGISANYISKKYNIPLVITEHSSIEKAVYIKESYKPLVKKSYIECDKLIAVGNGLKDEITRFSGREDIEVIHNLIPVDNFYISENTNEKFTFFSLAFLEGEKGMDILIKAFSEKFKDKNYKLIIGGEGSQKEGLINLSNNLGISNQVEFLGAISREEVAKYMSICNAFVLASLHETFGVVYIEALASGKPVIGTYNGGAEDIISDKNGLLVNKNDIKALGDAMVYLSENISSYDKENIRNECVERFSKDKIINEVINVYSNILKRGE
ncbi:glycosyltransferase family 4 protein [Clostridium sartagoforme]|uniref:Glycosyltransferase family 4 protein n=1 Tax=Clostridium sartagoforme TaxID=84031 RepID=A0A4S2DT09_9CLOT|nr:MULTISPECIES: glycosyltransferase [Clostridium]MBS5938905.1 glycosyltransferase [Clostridium sp.]TGY44384.1 glycosyltransferase family 4 protein [Clostridium sartagoforme]